MITVKEFINELDAEMAKIEKHIDLCEAGLKEDKPPIIKASLKRNLKYSKGCKDDVADKIYGMINLEDTRGSGWQAVSKEHFVILIELNDPTKHRINNSLSARDYGLCDRDFEFY